MSETLAAPSHLDIFPQLRRVPLFAQLSENALLDLAAKSALTNLDAAQTLFYQHDVGDTLYIILDGEIQLLTTFHDATLLLSVLYAGDFFGEMALFDDSTRSATARAGQPCRLLEIHKQEFQALLQSHPPLNTDLLRLLSLRVRETTLFRLGELIRKNQELAQANALLQKNYDATLHALSAALDLRDQATRGHSQRVTAYTLLIAIELDVPDSAREALRLGALLHDIGKIGISDTILRKPASLTPAEWSEMRKHPELGTALIEKIEFLESARDIVLSHHEKFDGSGYPHGLRGTNIPLGARIFAIADVFDALTTFRPYHDPISPQSAVAVIRSQSGSSFDPHVVAAFERVLPQILAAMRASFTE